jgi:ATP-binding cassette subfamily B protein
VPLLTATPAALRVAGPAAGPERRAFVLATALGIAGVGLELARPWPLALAVDFAFADRPLFGMSPGLVLAAAGVAVVVFTALAGLVDMHSELAAERAAERIGARLRQDVFDRAVTLSPRWHDRMRSGELISRLTTDISRVLDAIVAVSATLVPDAVRLVLVLVVLFAINPALALVAMAVVPVLMGFAVGQRRRVRHAEQDARAESGRFAATAADLLRNVRAIQAFGRAPRSSLAFGARSGAMRDANVRAVETEARWAPVADVVLACGSGLVLVVGGREVLAGRLRTGDLLVVVSYLSALYSPVRGLSRLSGVLAKSAASAARITDVLASADRVPEPAQPRVAPPVHRGVRFEQVRFGYRADRPVLADFDLDLPAGTTTCLLGRSGAGKSTLLNLLLRLYDVDGGAVTIDGVDVREMSTRSLRSQIAFVPQDPWLFDATIAENIAFGAPNAARHQVLDAGRTALVDEFAARLPFGYDTVVGEGGARLSGGQRRRLALARAVVSDAPIVLLDEPTASLDHESVAEVVDAIRHSTAGRTVLLVTHDLGLAELADNVVVLDRPSIVSMSAEPELVGATSRRREEV